MIDILKFKKNVYFKTSVRNNREIEREQYSFYILNFINFRNNASGLIFQISQRVMLLNVGS